MNIDELRPAAAPARVVFEMDDQRYRADMTSAQNLAIRLDFEGAQPRFFDAPPARMGTFSADGFTGDTRAGGSCNVGVLRLNPHCNGTHTECIGHLVDDDITLADLNLPAVMPATLVTVDSANSPAITLEKLQQALQRWKQPRFHSGLIIRTLPNGSGKRSRRYDFKNPPPFFDASALRIIRDAGVQHLLVDLPSLDAMNDDALTAHRIFWGLPPGSRSHAHAKRAQATVTEMIYAPDSIPDGYYLLNLQVPAFAADAAPSRPVIFPVE